MLANIPATRHEFARQTVLEHGLLKYLAVGLRAAFTWETCDEEHSRKLSTVQFIAKSFERHLERLMTLEEFDGYMDNVLDANPHLSRVVGSLKRDHAWFRQGMRQIATKVDRVSATDHGAFEDICDELAELLERLDEHDDKEAQLFARAFAQEEGGEG